MEHVSLDLAALDRRARDRDVADTHVRPVAGTLRDARITQIYEGTNRVQRMVIARNLIADVSELEHLADFIPIPEGMRQNRRLSGACTHLDS